MNATLSVLESTDCVNEAIQCLQQLQMFIPEYDSLPRILPKICSYLQTESPQFQTLAIGCLRRGLGVCSFKFRVKGEGRCIQDTETRFLNCLNVDPYLILEAKNIKING